MFPTTLSGYHGHKASLKRPLEDSRYPPKKRALMEHRAMENLTAGSLQYETGTMKHKAGSLQYETGTMKHKAGSQHDTFTELWQRSENVVSKVKQETLHQTYIRPRSDSLHSNFSVISENSDAVSTASREDSPFSFQTLYDHRTPERNPIRTLNSQIAKPLFQNEDRNASVARSDKLNYGNDGEIKEGSMASVDIPAEGNLEDGEKSVETVDEKSKNSLSVTFIPDSNRMTTESAKENFIKKVNCDLVHTSRSGCRDNSRVNPGSFHTSAMVSLIHRFNAEAEVEKSQNQSDSKTVTQADCAPNISDSLQTQSTLRAPKSITASDAQSGLQTQSTLRAPKSSSASDAQSGLQTQSTLRAPKSSTASDAQSGDSQAWESPDCAPDAVQEDSGKEVYKCPVCSRLIKQKGHFTVHLKSHENQNCKCRVCGQELQSLEKLQQHMKTAHKGDNPYKCEHCSREFSQYNNLRRHLRVHRAKIYKCDLCDREFNEEFYLTMHMGTHTGKRVYSCGVCNACFSSSHDLKMHVKTHSPSQLHTCDVCGKSFSKACVLRQHKKGHSGDRPHKCEKCLKTFIHRHHLTMHMRSHTENKPYICDICKKEFYQSSHLYKHLRCHDNVTEMPAVNAIKDRLDKLGMARAVDKSNVNAPTYVLSKEVGAPGEEMTNRVSGGQFSKRSRSRSSVAQGHPAVDNKVMNSVTASEQQIYTRQWPGSNSMTRMSVSRAVPQGLAPHVTGRPHFPWENVASLSRGVSNISNPYHHLYQAYTAQAKAYYDSMYRMNYMPNNARQNFHNPVDQHDRLNILQTAEEMRTKENLANSVEAVPEKVNVERKEKKPDVETKTGARADTKDEKRRTEVANELLKLSKSRDEDTRRDERNTPKLWTKETYHMDNNRTVDFTKCIGDIIDKTVRSQDSQKHGFPAACHTSSGFGNQSTRTGNLSIVLESPSKGQTQTSPARSTIDTSFTQLQRFSTPVNCPGTYAQKEALNLSQKKIKPDPTPHSSSYATGVSNTDGFHGNRIPISSNIWSYPSHIFSQNIHPAQSVSSRLPNLMPPFHLPHPHSGLSNPLLTYSYVNHLSARGPVVGMKSASPKKRHASYHDLHRTGSFLDSGNDDQHHRTRHVSEKSENRLTMPCLNAGIELRGRTLSDPREVKIEHYQVTREEAQENRLDQVEKVEVNQVRRGMASDSEIGAIRSNTESDVELESGTGSPCDNENDDTVSETKLKGTCDIAMQGKTSYFDDSLEEKKLEIDFQDGGRKSSKVNTGELSLSDVDEIRKLDMSKDSYELEEEEKDGVKATGTETVGKIEIKVSLVQSNIDREVEPSCSFDVMQGSTNGIEGREDGDTDVNKEARSTEVLKEEMDNQNLNLSEATMTCTHCLKKFSTAEDLDKHQAVHSEEIGPRDSYSGNQAFSKPFDQPCHLIQHHTGENSALQGAEEMALKRTDSSTEETETDGFECDFCGLKLPSIEEFRSHVTVHSVEKPYTCQLCLRNFAHKHNLNRHKMSHNSKNYECTICQRTFKESFYLQMHMKIHSDELNQTCEICDRQVPKSEIWKHTAQHMGNIIENPTYEQIGYRVEEILREKNLNKRMESSVNLGPLRGQFVKNDQSSTDQEQFPIHKPLTNGNRLEDIENLHIPMSKNDENCPKEHKLVPMARNGGKGFPLKDKVRGSDTNRAGKQRFSIKACR